MVSVYVLIVFGVCMPTRKPAWLLGVVGVPSYSYQKGPLFGPVYVPRRGADFTLSKGVSDRVRPYPRQLRCRVPLTGLGGVAALFGSVGGTPSGYWVCNGYGA